MSVRAGADAAYILPYMEHVVELIRINDHLWEIPRTGAMIVPGRIYASAKMIDELRDDPALTQVANVACLPGIVRYSLAMPDIHWGYGFPIGGVAAMDAREGVVSPGGVGYDINCGVRLARTHLQFKSVEPHIEKLVEALFEKIPAGVGAEGAIPGLSKEQLRQVVTEGAEWALKNGYATKRDLSIRRRVGGWRVRTRMRSASMRTSAGRSSSGHWDRGIISWS